MIKDCKGVDWTPVIKDNYFDYANKEETRKHGTLPMQFGEKPEIHPHSNNTKLTAK